MKKESVKWVLETLIIFFLTILLVSPEVLSFYISKQLERNHSVRTQHVLVDLLNRNILIKNLRLQDFRSDSLHLISGTVSELRLKGIGFSRQNKTKLISLHQISCKNADLNVQYDTMAEVSGKRSGNFKVGKIDRIIIEATNFHFTGRNGDQYNSEQTNLIFDPSGESNPFLKKSLKFSSRQISLNTSDSMYFISIKNVSGNLNRIRMDSLRVKPLFGDSEFARRKKFQSDRFDILIPEITMEINPQQNDSVKIKLLSLSSLNLDVFRDRRIDRKPGQKYYSLQYYLQQVNLPVCLDSLRVNDGVIRYREHGEKNNETGSVEFNKIKIAISNLRTGTIKDSSMQIHFQSQFMNAGPLEGRIIFPYGKHIFNCSGNLKDFSFTDINRMSVPAAGITFRKGYINKVTFDFTGGEEYASGKLEIDYKDLEFSVQGRKDDNDPNFISKLISSAASVFVKKDSEKNENAESAFHGTICYERRDDRFIFNYMWKSILSGLRSAMVKSFGPANGENKKPTRC